MANAVMISCQLGLPGSLWMSVTVILIISILLWMHDDDFSTSL